MNFYGYNNNSFQDFDMIKEARKERIQKALIEIKVKANQTKQAKKSRKEIEKERN